MKRRKRGSCVLTARASALPTCVQLPSFCPFPDLFPLLLLLCRWTFEVLELFLRRRNDVDVLGLFSWLFSAVLVLFLSKMPLFQSFLRILRREQPVFHCFCLLLLVSSQFQYIFSSSQLFLVSQSIFWCYGSQFFLIFFQFLDSFTHTRYASDFL